MNLYRPFRDLRLFWKLLVPFATLVVIVGAYGAFVLVRSEASRAQASLNRDLQELSLQARSTLQQRELYLLESANLVANLEGMAEAVAAGDAVTVEGLLRSVVALKGELAVAGVVQPDGRVLLALGPDAQPSSIAPPAGARFVADTLGSVSGGKQAGFISDGNRVLLAVAAPICTATDACAPSGSGLVGLDLTAVLGELTAGELSARLGHGGIAVFDADGGRLAASGVTPDALEEGAASGDRLVRAVDELDGEQVHNLFAPFVVQGERQGTVVVTLPEGQAFAAVRGTGMRLTLLLLVALVGIVGVGAVVSRAILRQVRPLVATNQRLGSGDLSARAPVVSGDEIGEIALGLNQMAEQLEASYATLESRVEQRTAEVERLLRQRTEFFTSLSHELRTPLGIILSESDLLLLDADEGDVASTGRAIRQSAAQLLGLVNEILELARAESGSLEVDPVPLSLHAFLDELGPTMTGLARGGDVALTVDLPASLPEISADRQRLREIVVNLVDNAVKYSPAGARVEVSAEAVGDEVVVRVTDNGHGIPPDVGDRLFEPFFRVDGVRPRGRHGSTGLGLALTRRLVEAHGGDIAYDSTYGGGTTFAFSLPVTVPLSGDRAGASPQVHVPQTSAS